MEPAVFLKFIELYGKAPTLREYLQYEPYFFVNEISYRDYILLTASPYGQAQSINL